jgi:hypothetical protein
MKIQASMRGQTAPANPVRSNNGFRAVAVILFLTLLLAGGGRARAQIPALDELAGDWQNASNLLSMPALNSGLGSAKAAREALSIGDLSFPPITMTGGTGAMLIDGQAPALDQTRWYPYQVLRTATAGNLKIGAAVRMLYEQRGLLFHIAVTNDGTSGQTFELKINLSANTSRHIRWGWGVPRDKETNRFAAMTMDEGQSLPLLDSRGELANCFSFERKPDGLSAQGDSGRAVWRATLRPKEVLSVNYVLAMGETDQAVHNLASNTAAHFDQAFAQVENDWEKRFDAMFTVKNPYFSGHLPVLVSSDKPLRRLYYMSAVSLLSVLRTGFPVAPRVYVSNTPESNCTMMYFWDTREWATTLALLDPVMMKRYLRDWLGKGIYNGYAEEYNTGTLQGPWYSANDYSVFILLNCYLNITGDRAFLSEKINGQTVLEHMDAIATNWKTLVKPGRTLADYGKAANLLECVPTYIHEVASFNAANVWMMRRTAEIEGAEGNKTRAGELRAEAAHLLPAVLALYEPGQGIWDALHRDGSRVPVRHVFDFATIALTIPDDLSPKMRGEMTGFVGRELLTDHWMRAQSLSDIAALKSNRPDHGPMGAFCAWPAETMAAMCALGEFDQALNFLHRCVGVTYEGPFSQSRELTGKTPDAPARITSRGGSPNSHQTYNASNGGSFAETIIRSFFGYQPDLLGRALISNATPRGFEGQLLNVRQGDKLFNISSTGQGLQVTAGK